MHLVSNSVTPNEVVEETRDGDTFYIVEDVPFVRAMSLAGGYVPHNEIEDSTPDWSVSLTANHPRNKPGEPWYRANLKDNVPISINTSRTVERKHVVGNAENPSFDGTWVRADFAVNATLANAMGGVAADIVGKIENGEQFDVSSQYVPKALEPGTYDGEHRANVEGIDSPDSIALLPHHPGQCSVEQGCGINPSGVTANAADVEVRIPTTDDPDGEDLDTTTGTMHANKSVNGITYQGTASGSLKESTIPDDDYESHFVFPADTKSESGFPLVDGEGRLRAGNVASAFRFRGDAPDEGELLGVLAAVNDEFDDPPIDPDSLDEARGVSSNSAFDHIKSFLGFASETDEGAESSVESNSQTMDDDKRQELINDITSNSNIKADSLEGMGDTCLQNTHEHVTANNDGDDPDDDPDDDPTDPQLGDDDEEYVTRDELDSFADDIVERVSANQKQSEKEEQVDRIIANSADYDEDSRDELLDTPESVLDSLESKATQSANVLGGRGASQQVSANAGEDLDDYSDGSI